MKTELGLGFMRYDLNKDYTSLIRYALESHISYFETSSFYLNNSCEDFVCNLLKQYPRDQYEYCGKLALQTIHTSNFEFYKEGYYRSLEKAPDHYFDVYLFQCLQPATLQLFLKNADEIKTFFTLEKQCGHIKKLGVCLQCDYNIMVRFFEEYDDIIDIAQMPFDYLTWIFAQGEEKYKFLSQRNIDIIAQSPLHGGLLAKNNLISIPEAISFIVDKAPYKILVGTSNIEHLKFLNEHCLQYTRTLSDEDINTIATAEKSNFYMTGCNACNRCVYYCQHSIPIPILINKYNAMISNPKENYQDYANLCYLPDYRDICTKCYSCECHCPQYLEIIKFLYKTFYTFRP